MQHVLMAILLMAVSPAQLVVNLSDGSRLIGTTTLTSLPVRSAALGTLQIPLTGIRTIKFSHDHEVVTVALTNGDSVSGSLGQWPLKLQTALGKVAIPTEHVTTISVSATARDGTRFSAAGEFSADSNPNGSWSYGWCETAGEEFRLYKETLPPNSMPDFIGWGTPVTGPCVASNAGKQVLHPDNSMTIRPGQLCLHPGPRGEYSVVRWTAPRSGRVQIAGAFTGLSGYRGLPPTTTDVHVLHNARSVYDSYINVEGHGNEAPIDLKQDIEAGDTVDFVVGFGHGNHGWDTTGLDVVITFNTETKGTHR